ncbi:MAG: hypothetical protein ACTSV7_13670 [Candidatus Baldrarchaeia archaeon]|nr:hypothetical protein [Candidatus Baldrarchaeota archaeon]
MARKLLNKLITNLSKEEFSQLLNCLFLRIPIIVFGENSDTINMFVDFLATLIPHREPIVYWTDFVTREEHLQLLSAEERDYDVKRVIILIYTQYAKRALSEFSEFKGCIIGVKSTSMTLEDAIKIILGKNDNCGVFYVSNLFKFRIYGKINMHFGKMLSEQVIEKTGVAMERIRKVLIKKLGKKQLNENILKILLDFDVEEEAIKEEILKEEILKFVHACRRALYLLSRIRLLEQFHIAGRISGKTLLETIGYFQTPPEDIILFIKAEWGEDFENILQKGRLSHIEDWLSSLW